MFASLLNFQIYEVSVRYFRNLREGNEEFLTQKRGVKTMNRKERRAMKSQQRQAHNNVNRPAIETKIKTAIEQADLVVYINPTLPRSLVQDRTLPDGAIRNGLRRSLDGSSRSQQERGV